MENTDTINITIAGEALNKMSKLCKENDIDYYNFVEDAISTYSWLIEETKKCNKIYSVDNSDNIQPLKINYKRR